MYTTRPKVDGYTLALLLFCAANVLELFVPRRDDSNYFVRMPIQLINGFLLLFMWTHLLAMKLNWTPVTRTITAFIWIICIYAGFYFAAHEFDFSDISPYLKLLLWTTSIIFFYEMMLRHGLYKKLMSLYIITFTAAASKKMIEASLFETETLGGGDTAALPLLFIVPVILICVNNNIKVIVMAAVAMLILVSMRRTAILGLVLSFPFIYKYIRAQLKSYHIMLFVVILGTVIIYTWSFIGDQVFYRFQNLFTGDAGGEKDSFGSGRSEFYKTVWDNWTGTGPQSLLFGNGLNSPHVLLMRVHNVQHSHNDFLEIGHTFGILGMFVWLRFLRFLWGLKGQLKMYSPENIQLFYICFLSYLVIALASGSILRITTMSFAFTVSILLYLVQNGKTVQSLLQARSYHEIPAPVLTP